MFFIWVVLAGLLQASVFRWLNLLALAAIFGGLRKGPLAGLLMGSATGIFAGIFSSSTVALNLALYGMIGFLSGIARSHMYYKENIFTEAVFSFFGLALFYVLYFILTSSAQTSVFTTVLLSALASPLVFKVLDCRPCE